MKQPFSFEVIACFLILICLNACEGIWPLSVRGASALDSERVIRVALVRGPYAYFESEVLKSYASDYKYLILIKKVATVDDAIKLLQEHKADIAAGHFNLESTSQLQVLPGPVYPDRLAAGSRGFLLGPTHFELQRTLATWLQGSTRKQLIQNLWALDLAPSASLSASDQEAFSRNRESRLPEVIGYFKKVAHEFQLDWKLIAALSYQESHWDDSARSATGVRGLMMITQNTAQTMGLQDRTENYQNVWGGARYLRSLIAEQPTSLSFRARTALALAAYNVGLGHIEDAQILARKRSLDPYSWKDLQTILPLLSYPEFYEQLEHGEARGSEPVVFTNRVLAFYDLLKGY